MTKRKWIDVVGAWILGALPASKDNQRIGDWASKSGENTKIVEEAEEASLTLPEQGASSKETDQDRRDTKRQNNGRENKNEQIEATSEGDGQKTRPKTVLGVNRQRENNETDSGKESWQGRETSDEQIITLEISSSTLNTLKNAGFSFTSELFGLTRDELLGINGIGPKAATEIDLALRDHKQDKAVAEKEASGNTDDRKSRSWIESQEVSFASANKESGIEEKAKDKSYMASLKSEKKSDLSGLENKVRLRMHAKHWLAREGRLPIAGDFDELDANNTAQKDLLGLSLVDRIKLLKELREPISESEWDYHYQAISSGNRSVNESYWRDKETMAAYVIRESKIKGQEGLVPAPTELPKEAAAVISRDEVSYREILSSRSLIDARDLNDREHEVDEYLIQKIVDEAATCLCDHPSDMPSPLQIRYYIDQNPTRTSADIGSIISVMSDYGRKDWGDIARSFGKKPQCVAVGEQLCATYIKYFVKDLGEYLWHLTPSELFVIFESQNLKAEKIVKVSKTFDALVEAVTSGVISKDDLNTWASGYNIEGIEQIVQEAQKPSIGLQQEPLDKKTFSQIERENESLENVAKSDNAERATSLLSQLPEINPTQILNALDKAGGIVNTSNSDESRVKFLKSKAKAKLWDACFNDEESISQELRILHRPDNSYSNEVLQSFLEEYDSAKSLVIPSSYEFKDGMGKLMEPKLMQKLVALRVLRNKQLINLSGTGTGKTLSAILSTQICGSKRIIISCPNNVVSSWQRALKAAYPSCKLATASDTAWICPKFKESDTIAYITNHEKFRDSLYDKCGNFTVDFNPDFIVIDEIHQSKQRVAEEASQRRQCIMRFIALSRQLNPNCKVLGMTATPVINNLLEGKSLIELITGDAIDTITEAVDLQSCMALYQSFVENGIRMNPGFLRRTTMNIDQIDITRLLPDVLAAANEGSYVEIEKVLVPPKLEMLSKLLREEADRTKTIIFIYYIKNTLRPIAKRLDSLGIRYGLYTGDDKTANEEGYVDSIDEFINGDTDILIATIQCAGTGIDGLQAICNRVIFFQLPWTATEFEQSIGRVDRDGTAFEKVQVHIPSTYITLPNSTRWSWCESKMRRINSKRDIARAAVDGEIPDPSAVLTPQEATKYWIGWLERLDAEAQA